MIRSIVCWMRAVLPPAWTLLAALLIYAFFESFYWFFILSVGSNEEVRKIMIPRDGCVLMACAAYALLRVVTFHPVFQSEYRNWLAATPWNSENPLPVGPIHLVPQDLLVLAIACGLLHHTQLSLLAVPITFLLCYLSCLGGSFFMTGQVWLGYSLMFGLGLVVRLSWWSDIAALGAAIVLYIVALIGLRRALARFPWQDSASRKSQKVFERFARQFKTNPQDDAQSGHPSALGWPFNTLSPKQELTVLSRGHYTLISLLVGWIAYAIFATPQGDEAASALGLGLHWIYLTVAGAGVRTWLYCRHHRPPISLAGRILTGRWIIPSYDQVLVAPLVTLAVGFGTPAIMSLLPISPTIVVPVSMTLTLLVLLNIGPSLLHWQLTGNHRLVPGISNKREFEEI